MMRKVLVTAYCLDSSAGSEPYIAFVQLKQMLNLYEKVHLITSDESNLSDLKSLQQNFPNKFTFSIQTRKKVSKLFGPAAFYLQYRFWQKSIRKHVISNEITYDVGVHTSLSTPLFGSGLALIDKPFIYGPVSFSFFHLRYLGIANVRAPLEILRNISIFAILIFDPFVRKSLSSAFKVIPGDNQTLKILNRVMLGNISLSKVIPSYAISKKVKSNSKTNTPSVIWVGRYLNRKSPLIPIYIMEEIMKQNSEIELHMIGKGKMKYQIQRYINLNNLNSRIFLHDWITKNELNILIESSRLLLFTSFRETLGNQIVESVSLGTPVLALDSSGASAWLKNDYVRWVKPRFWYTKRIASKKMSQELSNILTASIPKFDFESEYAKEHLSDYSDSIIVR